MSDWETFDVIEAAHFIKAVMLAEDTQYQNALTLLDAFESKCRLARRDHLPRLLEIRWLVRGRQILHGIHPQAVRGELKVLLKQIGKPQFIGDYLMSLCIRVIEYCLNSKQFELAKPWLAHLAQARMETRRAEKAMATFIVELSFWFEAGDPSALDNCLRRFEYYSETRAADGTIATLISQGFRALLRAKPNPAQAISDFVDALDHFEDRELLQFYFSRFDLRAFLSQKNRGG